MKAGILLVSLFFVSGLSAQQFSSEWQWLNPKPAGFNNHQICFAGNDNGFILNFTALIGVRGCIYLLDQNILFGFL
jgi:hypothetical protein